MALVTTKRNVDVLPGQAAPTVFHCSQHDVGATVILGLVNAGGNFPIPSGVTAIIQGSCSNGAVFTPVTATVSGSDITFNLSAEMTSIAGPTVCEAVLSKDTDVLGTANFILDVEPSAMGSDTPPVFTDAAWLWMVDKMGTETVSALEDKTVIDAINGKADQSDVTALSDAKLDKNQGTANAGKYLKVGADGNVETADIDVTTDKTLSIADKAADAKVVGDELTVLKADLNDLDESVNSVTWNLENMTPYDISRVTGNRATVETPEYANGYTLKATGYGGATSSFLYALPEIPEVNTTDIMYISFDVYIDAEITDLDGSNLYQPKSFGHKFGNTALQAKQWFTVRQRYTQDSAATKVGLNFGVPFVSTSVAKDKLFHVKNVVVLDLTASYGPGKEPSIEDINSILDDNGGYFDKINLFDAKQVVHDVDALKEDVPDLQTNVLAEAENGYIVAHPTDKNDGTYHVDNGAGKTVSINGAIASASAGDVIYAYGEFSPHSAGNNCASLDVTNKTGRAGETSQIIESPQNDNWYSLSGKVVATDTIKGVSFVATWNQSSSIRMYSRHIVAINLTAIFGKYNEPTKETLDKYFYAVSTSGAMDFSKATFEMFNIVSIGRRLTYPAGSYVVLDDEGNVKLGSVPDPNWSGWNEIGTYGQTNVANIPIYNKVHGTIETDGMMSVLPIWGCWSEAASSGNTHHGGHVFHGWTTDRKHRLTMVQNIYRDDEAAIFNYIPGDKSDTSEGVFLRLRLGADNNYKGLLIENFYADATYRNYQMSRATIYGRLNIAKPQNYNHIPASANAEGAKGDICFDENYVYFCVADNTWKRVALSTWT